MNAGVNTITNVFNVHSWSNCISLEHIREKGKNVDRFVLWVRV